MSDEVHITWHQHTVSRQDREKLNGHRGCVVWFTGLSGSGKSTVANCVDHLLLQRGLRSVLLDGDNVRHGLNAPASLLQDDHGEAYAKRFGLGFSAEDRRENIRRIGCVAQLFAASGAITLTAFVSPYREDRNAARRQVEQAGQVGDFIEVYLNTPLEICEQRDPKGLYRKARAGELKGMTGIDDPYEPPEAPEVELAPDRGDPQAMALSVIRYLEQQAVIPTC